MYAVWAVKCPSHISEINSELPGELSLTYYLIYLDKMIAFSKMEKENLQHLCVVFNCIWEHNLRLKPTRYKFFWEEINYLAHHIPGEDVRPNKENLKAVAEFGPPWTYMEIHFRARWGSIGNSSKDLHVSYNHYMNIYLGKVPVRRVSE